MSARDGGPAFPGFTQGASVKGMSLRDWFAGQALAGILASSVHQAPSNADCARYAYQLADAMLAARDAGEGVGEPREATKAPEAVSEG